MTGPEIDRDYLQGVELAEADEQDRAAAYRLFCQRLEADRRTQAELDDKEFEDRLREANKEAL